MSSVAGQLLLHPQLSRALKVLSTTVGRDKLYRLIQYFSRIVAFYYLRQGAAGNLEAKRWDSLKASLASGRKLLRIFKPFEHLQSAVKATPQGKGAWTEAAEFEKIAQVARQLAYAGYLSTDMLVYLQSIKFLSIAPDRFKAISTLSQRFWLAGIVLSLTSGAAGVVRVRKEAKRAGIVIDEKDGDGTARSKALVAQRSAIFTQLLQDSLDFCIPANNLGYLNLTEGTIGAIGTYTSWMALSALWKKA